MCRVLIWKVRVVLLMILRNGREAVSKNGYHSQQWWWVVEGRLRNGSLTPRLDKLFRERLPLPRFFVQIALCGTHCEPRARCSSTATAQLHTFGLSSCTAADRIAAAASARAGDVPQWRFVMLSSEMRSLRCDFAPCSCALPSQVTDMTNGASEHRPSTRTRAFVHLALSLVNRFNKPLGF